MDRFRAGLIGEQDRAGVGEAQVARGRHVEPVDLVGNPADLHRFLVKFKLFLQAVPSDDVPKHDKVVLYYLVGDDPGDGSDAVGTKLLVRGRRHDPGRTRA